MTGFYFLLSLIGIAIIARWFVQNDRLDDGQPTIGIFRMSEPTPPADDATSEGQINGVPPLKTMR